MTFVNTFALFWVIWTHILRCLCEEALLSSISNENNIVGKSKTVEHFSIDLYSCLTTVKFLNALSRTALKGFCDLLPLVWRPFSIGTHWFFRVESHNWRLLFKNLLEISKDKNEWLVVFYPFLLQVFQR